MESPILQSINSSWVIFVDNLLIEDVCKNKQKASKKQKLNDLFVEWRKQNIVIDITFLTEKRFEIRHKAKNLFQRRSTNTNADTGDCDVDSGNGPSSSWGDVSSKRISVSNSNNNNGSNISSNSCRCSSSSCHKSSSFSSSSSNSSSSSSNLLNYLFNISDKILA
ncbi:zinc finger CCHC domain-containing protein 10-like [Octopus bimaculoides]|uniref:zinc finger CCHC domain-containing protein 10-like n=1 Tax=Octopus bimaculoides TaxID=37653 RepID=UPI00071E3351|nr:zinc finger CCHC domain-containing protein 10-like [Octopus bimaculoides]|eukprot:XP_014773959.1 PREDICTED: zinc finger CCHC domain-containing protein 10-like [Octopus bimaculoides]